MEVQSLKNYEKIKILNQPTKYYTFDLRKVQSENEKQKLYKFRYKIYVEEMRRKQNWANHASKSVTDPLDKSGILLTANYQDQIVAGCRINFTYNSPIEYRDEFALELWEKKYRNQVTFLSKLMIEKKFRKGSLSLTFLKYIYLQVLHHGSEIMIIDCNSHLIPLFKKLGFLHYGQKFIHQEYGPVTPMAFYNLNRHHLKKINSPLLPVLDDYLNELKPKTKDSINEKI